MSALITMILLPPPPCPATHSSSHKVATGLRRCCFAILTFLTYAHVPSVMLCVHCPLIHMSEANSLLAAASFRSWVVILISCYTASQEQRQEPPPSLHEWEATSRAQHASCPYPFQLWFTMQAAYPELYLTEGQQEYWKTECSERRSSAGAV